MRYYFYIDREGRQTGPVRLEELQGKGILPTTPVWYEGLAEWTTAAEVEEMKGWFPPAFSGAATTPPAGGVQPAVPAPPAFNTQQQSQAQPQTPRPAAADIPQYKPETWLAAAIISTILCCLPLGVAAIIFSTNGSSQWERGERERAVKSFETAKILTFVSIGLGILFYVVYIVAIVAAGGF